MNMLFIVAGPVSTNTYLIADPATLEAAVIDPAWKGGRIAAEAKKRGWKIRQIWVTHAHSDHIDGVADLVDALDDAPLIGLHPADRPLWKPRSGTGLFRLRPRPSPVPGLALAHGMQLKLGSLEFEVRHSPGHTPGLCIFYCANEATCFCGDLIFQGSVGRTDFPGGNWDALEASIRSQVYTLPDSTRLLSGHGPETSVGEEKLTNPFVRG